MTDDHQADRAGQWRQNAIILVVSLMLAVFAAELVARMFFPSWAPRTGRVTRFWQHDPTLGWAHKPNEEGHFESFGFDTIIRINSHGFRGPERSFSRPDDKQRIIVLGDSFVWGFGVEEADIFTTQLERSLGDGTEVINLGVSGYSTDQELLLYRDIGRRYNADLVILTVATNDVALNSRPVAYVVYEKPVFELDGETLQLTNQPVPVKNWFTRSIFSLASHSYVVNQLNRTRESLHRERVLVPGGNRQRTRAFPSTNAERITLRLIAQLRDDVEADGAEFLVVLVDNIYAGKNFTNALAALDIRIVALDDVMGDETGRIHLPDNMHWNAAGHALAAQAIEITLHEMLPEATIEEGTPPGH